MARRSSRPASHAAPASRTRRSSFSSLDTQVIYCGDNLEKLRELPDECIDLIYIDPPFNSNRNYEVFWGETKEKRAFEDRHESTRAYIDFMRPRCMELHRVLKQTGSFYYHCDWHACHYVKIMLDQIFGEEAFLNEIIWQRTSAHNDPGQYGRVHDNIFYYAKGKKRTWNQLYEPLTERSFGAHDFERDEQGRLYRKRDLTAPAHGSSSGQYEWRGLYPPKGRMWSYTEENMVRLEREGRIVYTRNGMPRLKIFVEDLKGVPLQSVWSKPDLWLNSGAKERIGYPTQKPIALLERILETSSHPDEIILDAFCGCGTALVAAQQLGRRWIGIDISPTACRVMAERLEKVCGLRERRDFEVRDMPHTVEFLRKIPPFEFENWAVVALGGTPNRAKVGDQGIDGRIYPVGALPKKEANQLHFMDHWFPIQVKQKDKAGRPDIDSFEAVLMREDRPKGFFVSFDFTQDAENEVRAFFRRTGKEIVPVRVGQILAGEIPIRLA